MAKYLAKRDNVLYLDEGEFNQRDYDLLKIKIRKNVGKDGCGIHAPGRKHKVIEFKKDYPDSTIIWMYREPSECVASMKKLPNWEEYAKQELLNIKPILDEYGINNHSETFMKLVISTRTLGEEYFEARGLDPALRAPVEPTVEETTPAPLLQGSERGYMRVRDTKGEGLQLREGPGFAFATVHLLPEEALVKVMGGPVEADGYRWWQLTYEGLEGWSAGAWLQPLGEGETPP